MDKNSRKKAVVRAVTGGAALTGAVGAGFLAGRVRGVKQGLSRPGSPFEWKAERGRSVLLRGGNLVDVKRGQLQRERGLLFRDGQITEVVSTRDLDRVSADSEFDCGGLYVMPGLINCHVHALMPGASMIGLDLLLSVKRQALRNLEECATHGVTTVRDASSLPGVLSDLARGIERCELPGPRVVSCGPTLMAKGGYPDFARELPGPLAGKWGDVTIYVDSDESGREAVRRAVDQGARFIKLFFDDRSLFFGHKPLNVLEDGWVKAIVDEAHRLGRRVGVHQSQLSGFRKALRCGVDDYEHFPIDEPLSEVDIASFMGGDHHVTPTISVGMALGMVPPDHPCMGDPLVARMALMRERVQRELAPAFAEEAVVRSNLKASRIYGKGDVSHRLGASSMFDPELYVESLAKRNPNVQMLYEAGAKICCGNDGGTPGSYPGLLSVEMELLEWFGLSRVDILRAATINGAGLLDMEGELGSLEKGKLADILVLSANPLEDIRAVERVEGVFRGGVLVHAGHRLPPPL